MKTRFEQFFKLDLEIKKTLPTAHEEFIFTSTRESIKYLDSLYKVIKNLEHDFKKLNKLSYIIPEDKLKEIFYNIYAEFIKLNPNNKEEIKKFLEKRFFKMDFEIAYKVSNLFTGYTYFVPEEFSYILNECTSLNELLHLYHSYFLNSEEFFEEVPKIFEEQNFEQYPITLRGNDSNFARIIIEKLKNVSLGWTDICVFEDKILMMIRDRGHALSIEIEKENDLYFVKYHIPKICNLNMVNELKGIKKIGETEFSAIGNFSSNEENILEDLIEFIRKVPMDSDMKILQKHCK